MKLPIASIVGASLGVALFFLAAYAVWPYVAYFYTAAWMVR